VHQGVRYPERTYHPERVLTAAEAHRPQGQRPVRTPVSWDEALDDIAARLQAIAARDPQAILPYSYAGTMGLVQGEAWPRASSTSWAPAAGPHHLQQRRRRRAGGHLRRQDRHARGALRPAKLILIWGSNSITSNLHFWTFAQQAKRNGAKLICIDPRRTETAEKCHQHIALQPGTDGALALGLMHELITHDWLDHDYIARHVDGFDKLREGAAMAARAGGRGVRHHRRRGAPAGARLRHHPAGGHPAELRHAARARRRQCGAADRAAALPDRRLAPARRRPAAVGSRAGSACGPDARRCSGPTCWPAAPAHHQHEHHRRRPAARGVAGLRPEASRRWWSTTATRWRWRRTSPRWWPAFQRDDLFTVVLEHFLTDTADHADYVLPATTQLEHWDVHTTYGHTYVLINQPAVHRWARPCPTPDLPPLAARMGLTDPACRQRRNPGPPGRSPEVVDFAQLPSAAG
jgi:hypothetical protein